MSKAKVKARNDNGDAEAPPREAEPKPVSKESGGQVMAALVNCACK